jgi:excinuclease ABC subunit A
MGLGYLSMDRAAPTLSGGELQRINMSRCLGSVLTETLFCLDEPTAGLHARDSANLLGVIRDLQSLGNTVVVVEHERTIIEGADHFIEIGPKAGHEGGHVMFAGPPSKRPIVPFKTTKNTKPDQFDAGFLLLKGAKVHNLKDVSVKIPVGKVTAVCGVSGSGKTSLIKHTLYPLLEKFFDEDNQNEKLSSKVSENVIGQVGPKNLVLRHAEVMMVSQVSLGRSSRSTIGTYLGLMDEIRKILAATDEAKRQKLTPGSFSFNIAGGRCENCRGLGTVLEDLSFLGEMEITCPTCSGRRFQEKVLGVTYNGKNLIEILALTVAEARQFFFDKPVMVANLDAVLDVGMGYVTLGQHTSSFSGGEAQRLKLVQIMRDAKKGKPSILIFDEPTTGLSDKDVDRLMTQFDLLVSRGHTVIVVEHHLDVLRKADWLIEMGPEASALGGELVYEGPPKNLQSVEKSITAKYLF